MIAAVPFASDVLDAWFAAIVRASWQGAVAIGLVWVICRCLPRLSPSLRCWLWRLALLKMVLAAAPWSWLDVPVLPHSWAWRQSAVTVGPDSAAPAATMPAETVVPTSPHPETGADGAQVPMPDAAPDLASASERGTSKWGAMDAGLAALFGVWLVVVVGFFATVVVRARGARRWRRQWRLIKERSILTLAERLAEQLRLFQPPVLFEAESCTSPVVFGAMRTAIVLPSRLVARSTPEQLQLIFAHEMAHIRRGDLLGNWFSTFVSGLFFFHPFVWLALRECRLAQEVACDELAVRQPDVSVADYGRLLVDLAAECQAAGLRVVTVGVVESFRDCLQRRLSAMKSFRTRSRQAHVLSWLLAGMAVLGLLPWRLVAQAEPGAEPSAVAPSEAAQAPAPKEQNVPQEKQPLQIVKVQATSGPYTILVERVRRDAGRGISLTPSGFPMTGGTGVERTESHVSAHGATSASGGAFGGSAGSAFRRPNLILDLYVQARRRNAKSQLLCTVDGKVQGTDDQGRAVESPDLPAYLRLRLPGVQYPEGDGRTAVHLFVPPASPEAKEIRSLEGKLLVAEGRINRVTFRGRELSRRTTKRAGGVSVRLDKVRRSPQGIEVTLAVSPPASLKLARNPLEHLRAMMAAQGRVALVLEDSEGKTHACAGSTSGGSGSSTGRSGGTASGGGMATWSAGGSAGGRSWSMSGRSGGLSGRGSSDEMSSQDCHFDPLPEGVNMQSLTCTVTDCSGTPQTVAFRLEHVPLP